MKNNKPLYRSLLGVVAVSSLATGLTRAQTDNVVRWNFDNPREVLNSYHIENGTFQDGEFAGKTAYDPYFVLGLPKAGIDASKFNILRVRLYSSAPADAIGVYYKSGGGDWAIGAGPAIKEGWQTYEIDLNTQIGWKGGDAARPEARVWGGPDKTVTTLRIDPGNQEGRDVKIDWVELAMGGSAAAPASAPPPVSAPVAPALIGPTAWAWDKAGDMLGWTAGNFQSVEAAGGLLRGRTKYDSMLLSPLLNFPARDFGIFEFRLKSDVSGSGEIFFRRPGESMSDQRSLSHSIVGDGAFHTYRVHLDRDPNWTGTIEQLRFDPLNPEGANLEIEYARLLPSDSGNAIQNGGFELTAGTGATARPEQWKIDTGNGATASTVSLDKNSVSQGQYSLRLTGLTNNRVKLQPTSFELLKTGRQQFSFDYCAVKASKATLNIDFSGVYDGPLKEKISQSVSLPATTEWKTIQLNLQVPERAYKAMVSLEVEGGETVQIDNVGLQSLELKDITAEAQNSGEPTWSAYWIAAQDRIGKDTDPRNFRKTFELDDPAQVEQARVIVTADNIARLYVNGHALPPGPFYDDWKDADIYDIAPYLVKGRNVIGVQSINQGSAEAALAEVGVRLKGDRTIYLKTDDTWLAKTGILGDDWSAPSFDDSSWTKPELVAKVPGGPWGELPYTYLGPTLRLTNAKFKFDTSGTLGEKKQVTVSFVPTTVPQQPVTFSLDLLRSGQRGIIFYTQTLDTKNWKAGQPVTIGPVSVQLPRYAAPGNYKLRARVPYASLQPGGSTQPAASVQPAAVQPTAQNGVAAPAANDWLEQSFDLKLSGAVKNPVAKIVYLQNGQVPALSIDGKIHTVLHYMTDNGKPAIIKNTAAQGINLIWLNLGRGFGWKKGGPYDFSELDRVCSDLLNQQPNAYIVLNVPLDTVYNPGMREWNDQNPDELVKDNEGKVDIGGYNGAINKAPSYSSRVWMDDASAGLRAMIRHVRSSPIGERIIGYAPISGISWEWFYWGAQSQDFVDYSRPATEHFRRWAKARYNSIAALNAAWKTNLASFDGIAIPTKEQRLKTDSGIFLDPQKSQYLIDYREFFSDVISGDVLEFCHVIKEETKGGALAGTYYGYNMQVISAYLAQNTGHMALGKAMQSPDIDFVMTPSRYDDRGIGGGSGFMLTVDSAKLKGKYYIDQADIRTVNATGPGGDLARLENVSDTVAVLEREFANTLISGVACQYYDFGAGWTGADARLMDVVGRMQGIEAAMQKVPRKTMDPASSIAVIVDEKSTRYTGLLSNIHAFSVSNQINNLNRIGAGFDTYLLDDLDKLPDYRCYVFLNTYRITEEQRRFIDTKLKRDNKTLVWVYAPGVTDEKNLSFDRASQITGIKLGVDDGLAAPNVQVTSTNNALTKFVTPATVYGTIEKSAPLLYATEGEVLGKITGTERAGLVVKKFDNWTSVFSTAPNLPAPLLRGIAANAGVPIVNTNEGDVTYVSQRLFAVHTYGGGKRTFNVPVRTGRVKELLRGAEYEIKDGKFSCDLPEKSTVLFLLPEK